MSSWLSLLAIQSAAPFIEFCRGDQSHNVAKVQHVNATDSRGCRDEIAVRPRPC